MPPADWHPNAAYSTPMTNSLIVSTTGYWPRIYFSQYRAVVTGWQLTANNVSAAGVFARLTSTRWCGSHPTWCGGMRLYSWLCSLLKQIRFGVRHCAYNICKRRISVMVSKVPQSFKLFRSQVFLILFYFRLPSNVTVISRHLFTLSSCDKSSE